MKSKKRLPKWATTVTPLSKTIALILFILLPFFGFYLGIQYQKMEDKIASYTPMVLLPSSQK